MNSVKTFSDMFYTRKMKFSSRLLFDNKWLWSFKVKSYELFKVNQNVYFNLILMIYFYTNPLKIISVELIG